MTSRPAAAQHLRDLARLRRVRDRIDREYAQPLDVETGTRTWARTSSRKCAGAAPVPPPGQHLAKAENLSVFELRSAHCGELMPTLKRRDAFHDRFAGHLWLGEIVATAGLILPIFGLLRSGRGHLAPDRGRVLHRRHVLVHLDWTLDDPAGKTVEQIRPIRDEIERCIRTLIDEIA